MTAPTGSTAPFPVHSMPVVQPPRFSLQTATGPEISKGLTWMWTASSPGAIPMASGFLCTGWAWLNFKIPRGCLKRAEISTVKPDKAAVQSPTNPEPTGLGSIAPNALEQSNVDIANELVKMITTQRGFQANSKIITVTDQMLSELINIKR